MATYQEHITRIKSDWDAPIWAYNDKRASRAVATAAGVAIPHWYGHPTSLARLAPPTDDTFVLKPINGCSSRGVYPLQPVRGGYANLFTGQPTTWDTVTTAAHQAKISPLNQRLIARGHPDALRPPWILEQAILNDGELAYDWKAYVIGAKVQAILQMQRTATGTSVKWWTPEWSDAGNIKPNHVWRYRSDLPAPSDPAAMTAAWESIANQLPTVFARIDLYEAREPVFGEITPVPGAARAQFIPEWDQRLGLAWENAP